MCAVCSLSPEHRQLHEGLRCLGVINRACGDPDINLAVVGEDGVAAIGVAGPAREVAAGHIDLDPTAGAEHVMDFEGKTDALVNRGLPN
jgi:hypothetical protein